jgi:spore coat protein CotH
MLPRRLLLALICSLCSAAEPGSPAFSPADLFQMNKIWNVHISMPSAQFAAMQPRRHNDGNKLPGASWLQGAEGKRNGWGSIQGIEFFYAKGVLEFEGVRIPDVGVRYKGNGTFVNAQGSDKLSLKVHLNEYVKGQKFAKLKTLNFHNQVTDAGYMNEVLSYWLFRAAQVPAPRTAYARVSMTVPGKFEKKYLGLYVITENVDENFFEERNGGKSGAIFKPVTNDLFIDKGTDWKKYNQAYDPKTTLTPAQQNRVYEFARLLTKASDTEFNAKVGTFIDLPAFARHMAALMLLVDLDGILTSGQNYYLYLDPKTNLFQFVPWDLDHSFGGFNRGQLKSSANLSIRHPWEGNNKFMERVFAAPAFEKLYMARINEFNQTIFQPERFAQQVDLLAPVLRPSVSQESSRRLSGFDQTVRSGLIKEFPVRRIKSLLDQASGRSAGEIMRGVYR